MKKGYVLVGIIIVLVILTILSFSISQFLRESLNLNIVRANQARALALAEAGIMRAIVDYENDEAITNATDVLVAANQYYSFGGSSANFLLVDATDAEIKGGHNEKVEEMELTNINGSSSLTITNMTISWTTDSGETLQEINIGGGGKEYNNGSATSGTQVGVSYTINSGDDEDFKLKFNNDDVSGKTITAQFTFDDGSTRSAVILSSGNAGGNSFSLTATGKVTSNVTWKRTIEATYDVDSSEITSWKETLNHL